ncbi:MAG TPA: nitrogen fixation protein NifZ [Candidatus Competibacteraceae bacterium]|nr:nitrogen fixation protein NifZ [Candidatus Competibacteraceae bacterium]MCP5133329.1 nitrogen fixation protein NifZ [Gammaproteobacteria bacterium]HPF57257.1 nitrogen fixation protein NifZ [Candidatus Competibacteraceae bacterium]HRY17928.1 nitrogen fixation protein NifZ [Candidatus Competibacteraceae bacterium]
MLQPLFACGDAVRVVRNIRNDGTYPGQPAGALLVRRGSIGYVRHIGVFLQDQLVYSVHFLEPGQRIVGCREVELISADAPWIPNRFERGDRVITLRTLTVKGTVAAAISAVGEVMAVIRDSTPIHYHVLFGKRVLRVPEEALEPAVTSSSSALHSLEESC